MLSAVSARVAGLTQPAGHYAFDILACEDKALADDGSRRAMSRGERAVAARSLGLMQEFAHLAVTPDGVLIADREARLISRNDPGFAQMKLLGLLRQHHAEWATFMSCLPARSWVREIVGQP